MVQCIVFIDGPREDGEEGGVSYEGVDGGQSVGDAGESGGRGQSRLRPGKRAKLHPVQARQAPAETTHQPPYTGTGSTSIPGHPRQSILRCGLEIL